MPTTLLLLVLELLVGHQQAQHSPFIRISLHCQPLAVAVAPLQQMSLARPLF
jgi:hypothetical protein